jgi:hypothetical protein
VEISVEEFKRLVELFKNNPPDHSKQIDVTFNDARDIDKALIDSLIKTIKENERRMPNRVKTTKDLRKMLKGGVSI